MNLEPRALNDSSIMQSRAKREDGDRDRFVEYLRVTEGVAYSTIATDVKTRSGDKDFDYLLRSPFGKSLALEITRLPDLTEELAVISMGEKIHNALEPLIKPEDLSGRFLIQIPPYFFFSMNRLEGILKNRSSVIAEQIKSIANTLSERQTGSAETEVGPFGVRRVGEGCDIIFHGGFRPRWHPYDMRYFPEAVGRLIPRKNQQLAYECDRRVLLIRNTCYMAREVEIAEAISDFVSAEADDLTNIDEI